MQKSQIPLFKPFIPTIKINMNGEIKMKINQEKLNNYLQTIHGSICPLCGNNNWTISDQVFQAIEFDYKGIFNKWRFLPHGSSNLYNLR